ncbi:PA24C phospholipase, partial [Atractosteus spatula]|nr:PA24C phospholipase [Atractosteus spatula]
TYIRVSKTLCDGETKAIQKRKIKIQKALSDLKISCESDCVPPIAVLGSGGGGLRAMVALMGTLTELGAQNLLDTIMYLCGVSGSTWCMTSLYHNQTWSSDVEKAETEMVQRLTTGSFNLQKALARIIEAEKDENFFFTDVFATTVVHGIVKQVDEAFLSKKTDDEMNNPYPIFAVVDKEQRQKDEHNKGVWFEITRHEAGYSGYGAFVETPFFGSRFSGGNVEEPKYEMDMLYLQGLCGSCFADLPYILGIVLNYYRVLFLQLYLCSINLQSQFSFILQLLGPQHYQAEMLTTVPLLFDIKLQNLYIAALISAFNETLKEEAKTFVKNKTIQDCLNKLIDLLFDWIWGTKHNFLYKYPEYENTLPDYLLNNEKIYLEDAGFAINCGYPLVLRPDRGVQLILSFDFGIADPFETVTKAAKYCEKNNIPFPPIPPVSEEEKNCPSSCYIFPGENTPTVMHFPLFNKDSCESNNEKIEELKNIYRTAKGIYSEEEVDDLLEVAKNNVRKNKDKIITGMQNAVEAERKKKKQ